jgi:hypothetical protein
VGEKWRRSWSSGCRQWWQSAVSWSSPCDWGNVGQRDGGRREQGCCWWSGRNKWEASTTLNYWQRELGMGNRGKTTSPAAITRATFKHKLTICWRSNTHLGNRLPNSYKPIRHYRRRERRQWPQPRRESWGNEQPSWNRSNSNKWKIVFKYVKKRKRRQILAN